MLNIEELSRVAGGAMCMVKNNMGAPVNVAEGLSANSDPFNQPQSHLQPGESMFVNQGQFAAGSDRQMNWGTCTSGQSFSVEPRGGWWNSGAPTLR